MSTTYHPSNGPAPLPDLPQPSTPAPRSTFWFGPAGLRAGWSLCLFVLIVLTLVIVVGIGVSIVFIMLALMPGNSSHGTQALHSTRPKFDVSAWYVMFVTEALGIAIVLAATWIMSLIEGRRFREFGLGGSARRWKQLGAGMFWGFISLSLLIGMLLLSHAIVIDGRTLSGFPILIYALEWLLVFASVGFAEEIFFRGYIQYTLTRGIGHKGWGFWISAAVFSFGFAATHATNHGETPPGLVSVGLVGLVFCLSIWYTRSLWWAIGFHAMWDWAQSYFYGVADSGIVVQGHLLTAHPHGPALLSGGATGPEGSIFILPIYLFMIAVIYLTLRRERLLAPAPALEMPAPNESDEPLTNFEFALDD